MHALYVYIHVHYALNLHVNTHFNMRLCRVIASYPPPRHNGIVFTRYFSPVFVFLLICSEFFNSKMNVNLMSLNLVL